MRVLVISDSHKDLTSARLAICHTMEDGLDIVIHCGDHIEDAQQLEREFPDLTFYYVPGNCDGWFFKEDEKIKTISIEDQKVLITHGDRQNINLNYNTLIEAVKNENAQIGLCGHSHIAHIERQKESGITVVNPGSISLPRDSRYPSYAVLEIKKAKQLGVKIMLIVDGKSTEIPLKK